MGTRRLLSAFVVLVCIAPLFHVGRSDARQQAATPHPASAITEVPPAAAPADLGSVQLPADASGIVALLAGLPERVAGESRAQMSGGGEADRFVVSFGDDADGLGPPLIIQVVDVSTGDFYPAGWTADRVILTLASGADWTVEAVGQDGDLVWIRWQTTAAIAGEGSGTPEVGRTLYALN